MGRKPGHRCGSSDRLARCKKPHILRQRRLTSGLGRGPAFTPSGRIGEVADRGSDITGSRRQAQCTHERPGHRRRVGRVVEREVAGERRKVLGELSNQVILDGVVPEGHELAVFA